MEGLASGQEKRISDDGDQGTRERERERWREPPAVVMVMRDSGVSEVTPQILQPAGNDICVCVC
jgi:hypothetical protein